MGKYDRLGEFFKGNEENEVTLNFLEVERIVGNPLPPSAFQHFAWWANSETHETHSWSRCWLDAGWRVSSVDLNVKRVTFKKTPGTPILKAHSWTVLASNIALKRLDKSAFLYHGTGIPRELATFFGVEKLHSPGRTQPVTLTLAGKSFEGHFQCHATGNRIRLFWRQGISDLLAQYFPDHLSAYSMNATPPGERPEMRFQVAPSHAQIALSLLIPEVLEHDVEPEDPPDVSPGKEGATSYRWSKRIERNPKNRRAAIEFHGSVCIACGFDFGVTYGAAGAGFIEVHHLKPLASELQEVNVNPVTDLAPLCSNCHRVVHRDPRNVLTIEQLKQLLMLQKPS